MCPALHAPLSPPEAPQAGVRPCPRHVSPPALTLHPHAGLSWPLRYALTHLPALSAGARPVLSRARPSRGTCAQPSNPCMPAVADPRSPRSAPQRPHASLPRQMLGPHWRM